MKNEIGKAIKAWREHRGMTTTELAVAMKRPASYNGSISKIENGKQSITSDTLYALAKVFDVSLALLFAGPAAVELLEEEPTVEPVASRAAVEVGHINRDLFMAILTGFIANEFQYNRLVQHCGASNTELGATLYDRVQDIGIGLIQAGVPRF